MAYIFLDKKNKEILVDQFNYTYKIRIRRIHSKDKKAVLKNQWNFNQEFNQMEIKDGGQKMNTKSESKARKNTQASAESENNDSTIRGGYLDYL